MMTVTSTTTQAAVVERLRHMFSETLKLAEEWEADGNKDLSEFKNGKFITQSLDEWAFEFAALADEYEND